MASPEQDGFWDKENKGKQSLYRASVFPLVHTEHYRPVTVLGFQESPRADQSPAGVEKQDVDLFICFI